ncbi:hypothetical protein D0864_16139 [Hortaea werneckii]|uniref:Aminoglycoside phosphotransferase domain-containing protein n=1 Tax=Hortaea werneckii TaxID=91943 RepID=A0A3M7BRR9_HORWE|nr:hypothetical protein D0864_16139 [Hortaea werneckii]
MAVPDSFLAKTIDFNGTQYERLEPITDFRKDPCEARILYTCRMVSQPNDQEYILKVKVQRPNIARVPPRPASEDPSEPLSGPSEMTSAELKALQTFRENDTEGVPHLVAHKCELQGPQGPFPNGYISYSVMTKMPGQDLMALKFWSLEEEEREERRRAFLQVLKEIWRLNIRPYDCALRNILWDDRTKRCAIVDFEHYTEAPDPINMHETQELQRWGLVHRPPPSHWAVEWGLTRDYNARQWS